MYLTLGLGLGLGLRLVNKVICEATIVSGLKRDIALYADTYDKRKRKDMW